jgi:histidine ammonia-lyase
MCAAQAVDYRAPLKPAALIGDAHAIVRRAVRPLGQDRVFAGDLAAIRAQIGAGDFDRITAGLPS